MSASLYRLPPPDGWDADDSGMHRLPWWRLSSGERMYGHAGYVIGPDRDQQVADAERDALVVLAAAAYAKGDLAA